VGLVFMIVVVAKGKQINAIAFDQVFAVVLPGWSVLTASILRPLLGGVPGLARLAACLWPAAQTTVGLHNG